MSNKAIEWAVDIFTNFHYGSAVKKKVNDLIYQHGDNLIWSLHGNIIAKLNTNTNTVIVTLGGWATKSTMDRLNAMLQKLGLKGHPFRGYGNTRFAEHPTFCGTPITNVQEIPLKLSAIKAGEYDYE